MSVAEQQILLNTFRRMRLWNTFFQEHLILDVKTTFRLKGLIAKTSHIKNESCKCYLGNKEQKAMFLVVSRSDVHFGFDQPFFFACPIGRASKIARPKNRARRKKFVHPCKRDAYLLQFLCHMNSDVKFSQMLFFLIHITVQKLYSTKCKGILTIKQINIDLFWNKKVKNEKAYSHKYINRKTPVIVSFSVHLQAWGLTVLRKRDSNLDAFYEISEVLQNLIFTEDSWTTSSDFQLHCGHITCSISNKST